MGANLPPTSGIRVPADALRAFVGACFAGAGMRSDDAGLMAELLVRTDLRGVFSHGTRQTVGYVRMMRDGRVNPRPNIEERATTGTTRVYDGDGGMGHLPSWRAAHFVADTAGQLGVAAATTGNHFHFGGAGKYSRIAADRGCIGIAVSSHRWERKGTIRQGATGGSPISIAVPAGDDVPPLVIDMGTGYLPWSDEMFEASPFSYFKDMGLGAVAHALGGVLAGIWRPERIPPTSTWESNQGGFFAAFQIAALCDPEPFQAEMSRFIRECRSLKPFPGYDTAELPGGLEWRREQDFARDGIPVAPDHQESLQALAAELDLEAPFAAYEHTRFDAP